MRWIIALMMAVTLTGCGGGAGGDGGPTVAAAAAAPGCSGGCSAATPTALTIAEVNRILSQAVQEAQARGALGTIAVVDRSGNVLAVFKMTGAAATFNIRGEFLPLTTSPAAEELFAAYVAAAADAGQKVSGEFSGGCADSGFTAAVGCPTLCGVGPIGGNVHTADEWLDLDSIVPRAQALALAIMRLEPTAA